MASIEKVMKRDVISVRPDTPVVDAVALLVEHAISGLPVTEADGTIVGIITEKDVLVLFAEPPAAVSAFMTRNPTTFPIDAPLVDVVDCLMAKSFRRVLIHDHGKLVGLVSRADLMPAVLQSLVAQGD